MSISIRVKAVSAAAVLLTSCLSSSVVYANDYTIDLPLLEHKFSVAESVSPEHMQKLILTSSNTGVSGSGYIYDMLNTDEERIFYNRLLESCIEVNESDGDYETTPYVTYSDILDGTTAVEVAWLFHYDHPEFFWMDSHYWMYSNFTSNSLAFEVYECYQDGGERNAAKEQFDAVCDEYISGAVNYDTEYERAKYLFEQLRQDVVYQSGDLDQSAASALLDKATVCAGYSKSYELLCEAVGIDSVIYVGEVHGWNAIKLDNKWYIVDVTNGNFLFTEEEMHNYDVEHGLEYEITVTSSDGTTSTFECYMHDVSDRLFPMYYDSLPECNTVYVPGAGEVSATTTAPVTTTTTTTTSTTTITKPSEEYKTGDINNDYVIDLADSAKVLNIYSMNASGISFDLTYEELNAGDVDGNLMLNINDACIILKYYAYKAAGINADWSDVI